MEAATPATAAEPPAEAAAPAREAPAVSQPRVHDAAGTRAEATSEERDESGKFLSREAANYRHRLRETEAERDELRTRLENYERREVERLAGSAGLQVPGDVWTFGAELQNLRGEDGAIDPETVSGLVAEIVKNRPGLRSQATGDLGIGRGASAAGMTSPKVGLANC